MRITTTSLLITLATIACLNVTTLASPTNGNQLAPRSNASSSSALNPRKRPAPDDTDTAVHCPTPHCGETMQEFISQSDHRRRYFKCHACETFKWKDGNDWCDRDGNWHGNDGDANMVDDHYAHPYVGLSRQMEASAAAGATTEHALRHYQLSQQLSQINDIIRDMQRTGEWETLSNEVKFAYLEQQTSLWLAQRDARGQRSD